MMSYLSRPKQPTEADLKKEDLKPSGDIVRNLLIEEMQTRDLDADEIRYLMDSKPRDNIKIEFLPRNDPKTSYIFKTDDGDPAKHGYLRPLMLVHKLR